MRVGCVFVGLGVPEKVVVHGVVDIQEPLSELPMLYNL
jgi:hypothetical protein